MPGDGAPDSLATIVFCGRAPVMATDATFTHAAGEASPAVAPFVGQGPGREVVARISPPFEALPAHEISLAEITDAHARLYPDLQHPSKTLVDSTRLVQSSGVQSRRWVRPLKDVLGEPDLDRAFSETFEALRALVIQAAQQALDQPWVDQRRIGAVVLSSTTGWRAPSLAVHVIDGLGLPPTTRDLTGNVYGCAGAGWAAARAWEQLALYPDSLVLLLSAEAFSITQHPDDENTSGFIYRGLAGDGAFAAVAGAADVPGPALRVHGPALELTMPGTTGDYRLTSGARGLVFDSKPTGLQTLREAMGPVRSWLRWGNTDAWPLDFVLCHTGGVKIMDVIAEELSLPDHVLRHSRASLTQRANMASSSLWNVMARTMADPPAPGSRGLMLTPGPGFKIIALRVSIDA